MEAGFFDLSSQNFIDINLIKKLACILKQIQKPLLLAAAFAYNVNPRKFVVTFFVP